MKLSEIYIKNSLEREGKRLKPVKITIFLAVLSLTLYALFFNSVINEIQTGAVKSSGDFHSKIFLELNEERANSLENNINIEKVAYLGKGEDIQIKDKEFTLKIYLGDKNYFETMEPVFSEGSYPTKSDELIIPKITAVDLGLDIGDTLEAGGKSYIITGLFDYNVRSWEKETVAHSFEDSGTLRDKANTVILWFKDIKDTYTLTPKIADSLGLDFEKEFELGNIAFNYQYLSSRNIQISKDLMDRGYQSNGIRQTYRVSIIGMVLIGIFFVIIIKNIFSVWENKHIREYGLYLSVGAKTSDLQKLILKRLFRIAKIPVALGIVIGTVFNEIMIRIVNHFYVLSQGNLPLERISKFTSKISVQTYLSILVATALVLLISALFPVFKISRINPIEGMKLYRTQNSKKKRKFKIRGKSFVKDLSKINFNMEKGKNIISILSLSISLLILSTILGLSSGLNLDTTHNYADELQYYDYRIDYHNTERLPEQLISELTGDYERDYLIYRKTYLYLNRDTLGDNFIPNELLNVDDIDQNLSVNLYGIDEHSFNKLSQEYGRESVDYENGVFLVNQYPIDFGVPYDELEYGKILRENIQNINLNYNWNEYEVSENISNLQVAGLIDDKDVLNIPMSERSLMAIVSMDKLFGIIEELEVEDDLHNEEKFFIKVGEEGKLAEIKGISSKYLDSRDVEYYDRESSKIFINNSYMMLYTVLFIASAFIGIVGLFNSYSASNSLKESRKQEFVLLQIIGMDKKSLKKLILKELNMIMAIILVMSLIFMVIAVLLSSSAYKFFSPVRIFLNMKLYIWGVYLVIVYIILRRNYLKIIEDVDLLNNSRIM